METPTPTIVPLPPFIPRKPNRYKPRAAAAAIVPPTPVALAMIAAEDVTPGPDELAFTAVFNTSADAPLVNIDTADALKWTARFDGQRFEGNTLTLRSPTSILVEMVFVENEAGPDEVNYANAPSDIADTLGRHLAAFAGFPL